MTDIDDAFALLPERLRVTLLGVVQLRRETPEWNVGVRNIGLEPDINLERDYEEGWCASAYPAWTGAGGRWEWHWVTANHSGVTPRLSEAMEQIVKALEKE